VNFLEASSLTQAESGFVGGIECFTTFCDLFAPFHSTLGDTIHTVDLYSDFTLIASTPEEPVPAAVWLFGSGLLGLIVCQGERLMQH
ncbi:MAG: hypothetical protein KAT61_08995, partial [Gammaproteobacteria bacterium]|nr:hypothetical protein [Gammaproteobacteria bacterium]